MEAVQKICIRPNSLVRRVVHICYLFLLIRYQTLLNIITVIGDSIVLFTKQKNP